MNGLADLKTFARRYAEAWCSQNPESVAAFFAENGSLTVKRRTARRWTSGDYQGSARLHARFSGHGRDGGQAVARLGRNEVSLDVDRNQHRHPRHGETRSNQRLRTLEDRQRRTHRRIERPFRQRRVRTPAQARSRLEPKIISTLESPLKKNAHI